MTYAAFLSAVLALLLAPGPTNTLVALAGAQRGLPQVLRLMPAELAGYLTTVLPLVWLGAGVLAQWPGAAVALKLAAAFWVLFLAVKLWGAHADDSAGEVGARRIFVTTMLNPKALIFGLVLLPPPSDQTFVPKLGLFGLSVLGVALVWGTLGAFARARDAGGTRMRIAQRVASVWLGVVALTLITGVVRA